MISVRKNRVLGYNVKISNEAKEYIAEKGFDSKFGARPLKRAIQKYFEDPISEEIINSILMKVTQLMFLLNKDKTDLIIKITKPRNKSKKSKFQN